MPSTWFPDLAVLVRMYFVSMYGQYYPTEGLPRGVKDALFFFTATSDTIYDLACIIVLGVAKCTLVFVQQFLRPC